MPFHKTPLELFVNSFVKQKKRDKTGRNFINKAVALIDGKLGYCCDHPSGTLDLVTPNDNILTNTVRMYLTTMTRAGNEQSLTRAKEKLQGFITQCCD